ncbi:MAG: hypothetical protein WA821_02130 [Anaerolineales bacterium]
MKTGDRVKLSGGYDMEPPWLRGGNGYFATALGFLDNNDERRAGDGGLSVLIEFDEVIEFGGLSGKYGLLDLRYTNQPWEVSGPVHVTLLDHKIQSIEEKTKDSSRWMESHAVYQVVRNQ